ncbi:MAG: hypothetical protein PWQ96_1929 [Clostridia bacterium]|jgi:uncharacterized integral membrane protein|nr:hypothetical protein [Clostridiales bacterium]MDK2986285.1 hypothetical protein [Clostridia bacterium]
MQIYLVGALIFALIVAIFSINNPNPVPVNFLFWGFQAPLVLVILGSAVFGAVVVFLLGMVKQFSMIRKVRSLESANQKLSRQLAEMKNLKEDEQSKTSEENYDKEATE